MVDSILCDQLKLGVKCFDGRVDFPEHILSLLTQQKDAVESYVTLLSRLSTPQKKGGTTARSHAVLSKHRCLNPVQC